MDFGKRPRDCIYLSVHVTKRDILPLKLYLENIIMKVNINAIILRYIIVWALRLLVRLVPRFNQYYSSLNDTLSEVLIPYIAFIHEWGPILRLKIFIKFHNMRTNDQLNGMKSKKLKIRNGKNRIFNWIIDLGGGMWGFGGLK